MNKSVARGDACNKEEIGLFLGAELFHRTAHSCSTWQGR